MKQIAVFASGTGTNAEKMIEHFSGNLSARVALIVCNKAGAGVLEIAKKWGIEAILVEKLGFFGPKSCILPLKQRNIDFIVLAGFLWKIPAELVAAYPRKMVNIHPALLPKYGGKGMYGMKVHEAVIAAGEKESGISIHYVNEHYDEGDIIFQASCPVEPGNSPSDLAAKIHVLEHTHFAKVVEWLLS
ncbi:MAG: phosphoribosylglycinamide formyltransferase [Sphingobacteriia bacterium]|nr:MAG: phosphoribosylglycinamide formyltransferase [Sphingobacteriia bacterium]